jgi:primosomal protein N'
MSLLEIEIITYCHKCSKVYNGKHKNCPHCGSFDLLLFVPGPTIKDWIATEQKLESVKSEQCGCCDYFLYGPDILG